MPRGHESTWPYTGRYTPPPPSLKRGPRRPPGREQPPPPPQGTAALGSPRPAPGGLSGVTPEPAQPFHAPPRTSRSTRARLVSPAPAHNRQGPGPRSPGAQPCPLPPVSIRRGPSQSGLAARGRRGAPPCLHQDSPPWMMLGGIRPRQLETRVEELRGVLRSNMRRSIKDYWRGRVPDRQLR